MQLGLVTTLLRSDELTATVYSDWALSKIMKAGFFIVVVDDC